jgi:hypothetical protein
MDTSVWWMDRGHCWRSLWRSMFASHSHCDHRFLVGELDHWPIRAPRGTGEEHGLLHKWNHQISTLHFYKITSILAQVGEISMKLIVVKFTYSPVILDLLGLQQR